MRVAVVTQYFPTSHQRWAGHSAYQTLRPLAKKCELEVFYPDATYPSFLKPKTKGASADPSWHPPDVAATYVRYPALPIVSRPLNGFVAGHMLFSSVKTFRPDVVLDYTAYPDGLAALRIGRKLGVPVVITAIGTDLNRMPGRLVAELTKYVLRNVDFTITVSGDLLKTARALGAPVDRSQAILNGCDTSIFHPRDRLEAREALGVDRDAELAVYVGRLDVRKGLRELIEAAAIVRKKRPTFQCRIIGDGPDKPLLQEAIAAHGAGEAVSLVPSCLTAGVAAWMAASDLVTLPSYKEGCPNVVLEALASGRPVVATNVGGIPEITDDASGKLVDAMNVPQLASALDETLSRRWDAAEIASRHDRSWADVADDNLAILERLARR